MIPIKRIFKITGLTALFSMVLIVAFGYLYGFDHYVVHRQTFYFADLPEEFEGYKIVQFSDMHIGTFKFADDRSEDVKTIVNLINKERPDAVMFTGDLVNRKSSELDGYDDVLSALDAKDGVFAVLGNHDYATYNRGITPDDAHADVLKLVERERSYGWNVLLNSHAIIRRGNDSIAVIGVENDGRPPFPSLGNLPRATKGIKNNTFSVMLSHDPYHWQSKILKYRPLRIQLTLSGHTHSGQFKVFGWSPVAIINDHWSGAYVYRSRILNVSDGCGSVMWPFRFGAWPEINVITLRRKP